MSETIAEIRARHEAVKKNRPKWNVFHGGFEAAQAHEDRATLLRLLSEERARRVEWQPIETAPKDGTQILACQQFSEHLTAQGYVPDFSIVKWDDREKDFVAMADGYMSIKSQGDTWTIYHEPYVTHWQPLPTPPATHKDTQDE